MNPPLSTSSPEPTLARGTRRHTYTLLVMTLNEIVGMKAIMPKVQAGWVDQIIVVDGKSTDGTIEWARAQGYEVYVQREKGFRNAYREVWPLVRGSAVIYFTPDGNSLPEAIPALISKIEEGNDLVIASRYLGKAKSYDDDWLTAFGNRLFQVLINGLLRPRGSRWMSDPMVMLRAHRKGLPHELGLDREEEFRFFERMLRTRVDWIPLMSMRVLRRGLRWAEVPADEPARIGGVRKLQAFKWGAVFLLQLFREWVRGSRSRRPR